MRWDYNPSVAVGDTSLCTREAFVTAGVIMITVGSDIIRPFLIGWDYNPTVAVGDTSLCTREAVRPILTGWDLNPSVTHLFLNA